MFTRLAAVAKREVKEESYFYYEMTNEPMSSLFKNMMMRKPDKPSLEKALVTDEESKKLDFKSGQNNYSYVMDGSTLLHRVCWVKGSSVKKIAISYV